MKAHWGGGPLKVVYSGWGIGSVILSFKSDLQVGVQIPPPHLRAMVAHLDLVFGSEMTFGPGIWMMMSKETVLSFTPVTGRKNEASWCLPGRYVVRNHKTVGTESLSTASRASAVCTVGPAQAAQCPLPWFLPGLSLDQSWHGRRGIEGSGLGGGEDSSLPGPMSGWINAVGV